MAGHEALHLAGVIAATGEGGADHLQKAQLLFADAAEGVELLRGHKTIHGQMLGAWGEILADGDDVHPVGAQVAQHVDHLVVGFTEAHHQAGLAVSTRPVVPNPLQKFQGPLVNALRSCQAVHPRHCFDVVVEHVGCCRHHRGQGVPVAAEVGNQQLDRGER